MVAKVIMPFPWEKVKKITELILGYASWKVSEINKNQVYIYSNDVMVLIIQCVPGKNPSLHFRASLTPNNVAFLAGTYFLAFEFVLGEVFDIDFDGVLIYNAEALTFAAKHANHLWLSNDAGLDMNLPEGKFILNKPRGIGVDTNRLLNQPFDKDKDKIN